MNQPTATNPTIDARRHVEDNVFTTYFLGETIVGRLFITAHPSIPFEVFAYNSPEGGGIDSQRVMTEAEAATFVEEFTANASQTDARKSEQ